MSDNPKVQDQDVENSRNIVNSPLSVEYVQEKISEFSDLFSSICRIPILNCVGADKENLFYLLITLKKNINYALEELGKGCSKREYNFTCGICDAPIIVKAGQDFWDGLQTHEHFEELVNDLLQNKLKITIDPPLSSDHNTRQMKMGFNSDHNETNNSGDSNTDSGIEQTEHENDQLLNNESSRNDLNMPSTSRQLESQKDEDVNSFRFNFPIKYHDSVGDKIYPSRLMEGVQKYDKVKSYYTIQKTGPSKATCLACPCEMHSPRINKNILTNHAMGHRHMRATSDHRILEFLKIYHEFWLKEEECVQAHQVYFRLHSKEVMTCVLCNMYVALGHIRSHLDLDVHKLSVLEMFTRKNSAYHLLNLQVQIYGVSPPDEVVQKPKDEKPQNTPKSNKTPRKLNASESDRSVQGQSKQTKGNQQDETHSIIKSVSQENSKNVLDLLPNRLKEDIKHFKSIEHEGKPFILCRLCNLKIPENFKIIKEHVITSPKHAKNQKQKYSYFCEICNKREPTEYTWYTHNWDGPRHSNMAESRKARVTEYECVTCKTVIFGDELSLRRHSETAEKSGKKKDINRLPEQVKLIFKNSESILDEVAKLQAQVDEVHQSNQTAECCEKIQSALREIYHSCKVYPFGSRVTGIGNKDSDLDVFVDIGGMYAGEQQQDARDQVLIIRHAAKAFYKREISQEYSHIFKVETARTPILKLHHVPTNLDCDLSFRHGLSVENTKFLRLCMDLQPKMQQMVMLIKKWAEHLSYENLSTYALVTMAIFYMQINKYLLSVEMIRELEDTESSYINGWKTLAHTIPHSDLQEHISPYPHGVDVLAKAFFHYYAKFDFNTYVVCPLLGRLVLKSHFLEQNGRQLPKEMDTYLDQLAGEDPEYFRANSLMCIQDPFDLSHNLTKAVQQGTLGRFQTMCKLTAEHINLENS